MVHPCFTGSGQDINAEDAARRGCQVGSPAREPFRHGLGLCAHAHGGRLPGMMTEIYLWHACSCQELNFHLDAAHDD
jgi:hypothetical protein